jgi:hypothetical protein
MCPREQPKLCFFREQMCLKLCVIITFASKLWLNCFQLQNCSSLQDLSNDRSQSYIKTNIRWLWLLKNSKHMFLWRIWAFPKKSSSLFEEVDFSLRNNHVPGEKEFKLFFFPQGTIMSPGEGVEVVFFSQETIMSPWKGI